VNRTCPILTRRKDHTAVDDIPCLEYDCQLWDRMEGNCAINLTWLYLKAIATNIQAMGGGRK
jgi:hypothetical protein